MPVVISLLRGVNVGGHATVRMDALRKLYGELGLQDAQTYVQSGNVVFRTPGRSLPALAKRIEAGIAGTFGVNTSVILRTTAEMRSVVAANPFAARNDVEPAKLGVTFLQTDPGEEARLKIREVKVSPEELWIVGRELYIFYPNGMGRSKLPLAALERALKAPATTRNWNSVTKLLAMAEKMEGGKLLR